MSRSPAAFAGRGAEQEMIEPQARDNDCALLTLRLPPSFPAKAGNPIGRGLSIIHCRLCPELGAGPGREVCGGVSASRTGLQRQVTGRVTFRACLEVRYVVFGAFQRSEHAMKRRTFLKGSALA